MGRRNFNWQRIKQRPLNYLMSSTLRWLMWLSKTARRSSAGFVLPTTVLLLLVVSLTMGALSFRSFSRVEKTIAFRDQQIVDGVAAPAIDRAKAKLEYLFTQDDRIAKRPPPSDDLFGALTADIAAGAANPDDDPYTLPDETPIDVNGNGTLDDPAWAFNFEGTTVVYSLLVSHERDPDGLAGPAAAVSLIDDDTQSKADALVTRNAPISTASPNASCPVSRLSGEGWQDAGGNLQKNFQVNVLAISGSGGPNRTISASEYQQVRSSPKGNKYGAYFRYDMDISPGDPFRWNGAMHSESNIIAGRNLEAYLISSPKSCVYSLDNSEITISEALDGDGDNLPDGYKGNLAYGLVRDNEFDAGAQKNVNFHNDVAVNGVNVNVDKVELNAGNDSVDPNNNGELDKVYANPVKIFTEDVTEALDGTGFNFENPNVDSEFVDGRVKNFAETDRPILDDGFRADNRFGPKPLYDNKTDLAGNVIGTPIPAGRADLNALDPATGAYGLDGYWERRAIGEGLRVVVGQRLELGNRFGWDGSSEPLYPPENVAALSNDDPKLVKGPSEAKQQRTLRDNLAAVQGMVVYHHTEFDGELPYICMASTVHPGTDETLINSRTFSGDIKNNFLTGDGTNGWEFDFQSEYADSAAFADSVRPKRGLGRALRNMALFSGDPWGGAPAFSPVQGVSGNAPGTNLDPGDEFVHPYPYLSMWGDFSVLRRILFTFDPATGVNTDNIPNAAAYDALSPADKSALHSAACTLGMLANNIEKLGNEYGKILATINPTTLKSPLLDRINAQFPATVPDGEQAQKWLDDLAASALTAADLENAQILALYQQVVRDRLYGFETGARSSACPLDLVAYPKIVNAFCSSDQLPAYPSLYYLFPYRAHNQDGSLVASDAANANPNYLNIAAITEAGGSLADTLPKTNGEYVTEGLPSTGAVGRYIFDSDNPTTNIRVNTNAVYVPINPSDFEDLGNIALDARASVADFRQPTSTVVSGTLTSRDDLQRNLISDNGTITELAFLDKAMMDGRQGMNVRVLELDIGKLTLDQPFDSGSVAWIPEESGIFYAAREDAVREDTIVRPRQATWAICQVFENLIDNGKACPMVLTPSQANQKDTYDPPLNTTNSISPKPVDMYPDPDRRPNGFRLFNGYNLNRSDDNQAAGISFVTDNPAYIYGNFNLHQDKTNVAVPPAAPNIVEEFIGAGQLLGADFASLADEGDAENLFYGREDLDDRFARGDTDTWRSAEIFSDAVTILSDNFRDGWIEDAFTFGIGATVGNPPVASSYLNSNRAERPDLTQRVDENRWLREDNDSSVQCDAAGTCGLPIRFSRDGLPQKWKAGTSTFEDYPANFGDDFIDVVSTTNAEPVKEARQKNQVTAPDNVRVNALMIAGIVPMRKDQTYGGIQNFPRLLEYWKDKNLIISGGFFQLNFSTQATAPQDQDAWEPGSTPISGQNFNPFYNPAKRIWGYDVAFQYTSVAPLAQRFIRVGSPRSEYFREMPLDDPYIQNLCTALQAEDASIGSCD